MKTTDPKDIREQLKIIRRDGQDTKIIVSVVTDEGGEPVRGELYQVTDGEIRVIVDDDEIVVAISKIVSLSHDFDPSFQPTPS